jgi:hypothetical protein
MWQIAGSSEVGTSHASSDTPCQDANDYRQLPGGFALAAVADGLGSAERSHLGSQLAVETVLNALEGELQQPLPEGSISLQADMIGRMEKAFTLSRRALEKKAAELEIPLRELGTTLLAVACSPEWLITGHIGDGAIIGYWAEDGLKTASVPQRGEYANVTMPLTMDGALDQVYYQFWPIGPVSVVLMSDGLQSLALDTRLNTPYEPFLRPFIEAVTRAEIDPKVLNRSLISFLKSDRVNEKTDDDKTLVIVGRKPLVAMGTAEADTIRLQPFPPPLSDPKTLNSQSILLARQSPPSKPMEGARNLEDTTNPLPNSMVNNLPPFIKEAEKLEKEADELERLAAENETYARKLMADSREDLSTNKVSKSEWIAIRKLQDLADEQRKKAEKKKIKAKELRGGKTDKSPFRITLK